ncbi:MAG: leucyl aminopeptidase family protein, partial [Pseudomonadota bacterium]
MPTHSALIAKADSVAPVHLFSKEDWEGVEGLPDDLMAIATAQNFTGQSGQMVLTATADGHVSGVLFGLGAGADALAVAALSAKLPTGAYEIARSGGQTQAQIA